MHMFDEHGVCVSTTCLDPVTDNEPQHTYKCFLFAFPMIGALLVAISRTRDYRHHWQDVFIGSLLGMYKVVTGNMRCFVSSLSNIMELGAGIAYFAYRQYYPSLVHVQCHCPYGPRFVALESEQDHSGDGDIRNGASRLPDDESSLDSSTLPTSLRYKPARTDLPNGSHSPTYAHH